MLGPLREGFVGASGILDEPAGVEGRSDAAPVGSYPLASARPEGTPEERDYTYRPDPQTGSNEFVRFGPQMDVKGRAFAYAT